MAARTRLIDCRWLGYTGVGRVTELLLRGMCELDPPGRWILWGPAAVEDLRWGAARVVPSRCSPLSWAGQRERPPDADDRLFLHAVRPLARRGGVVVVHDTIPVRWAPTAAERAAWRLYLMASARRADAVVVNSAATARRVGADLGVAVAGRLHLPVDPDTVARIRLERADRGHRPGPMLYVGQRKPHKNLERAVAAFGQSSFGRSGGRFVIVGGTGTPVPGAGAGVEVVAHCDDDRLAALYAAAGFVIVPSLEEGWGLPIVEALAAGVPVCCSEGEPMSEASQGLADVFDPTSVTSMAAAIDRCARRAEAGETPPVPVLPSLRDTAAEIVAVLDEVARRGPQPGGAT